MRSLKLVSLTLILSAMVAGPVTAMAQKASKKSNMAADIDSLGGNQELAEMAQNIKSQTKTRIVQDRIVDRRNRLEVGLNYGLAYGGDAYLQTKALGVQADFHITPRWSLGARFYDFSNTLSPEGKRIFEAAKANSNAYGTGYAVDIDYPEQALMAVLNWYPIYGKTSFLDMGVTQFDLYLLAGGGQMTLSSGTTGIATAGLGVGAWVTQHVTARAEIRYQTYQDQPVTGSRNLDTVVGTLGFGWML